MPKERDYPDFPGPSGPYRKLHGGPWDGEKIRFRDDQTELVLRGYPGSVVYPDGQYIGRYVVREIEQRNRTIKRVEWETAEQKEALVRERLRLPGIAVY